MTGCRLALVSDKESLVSVGMMAKTLGATP